MKHILSTISSKGQVTVPAAVRQHLGVHVNEKIVFVIEDEGAVRLTAPEYPTIASLAGAAGTLKKARSWREMRRIAREDALAAKSGDE